jgi:hypothetical protein
VEPTIDFDALQQRIELVTRILLECIGFARAARRFFLLCVIVTCVWCVVTIMKFNPEINLGTIIEIFTFIALALGAARKFGVIETKLNVMYGWFQTEIINGHRFHSDRMTETRQFYDTRDK